MADWQFHGMAVGVGAAITNFDGRRWETATDRDRTAEPEARAEQNDSKKAAEATPRLEAAAEEPYSATGGPGPRVPCWCCLSFYRAEN